MPRRRVFTDAQITALFALPTTEAANQTLARLTRLPTTCEIRTC